MKLHLIKSSLIVTTVLSITLISCLKDKAYDNGEIQSGSGHNSTIKVVAVDLTVSSTDNFLFASFDNSSSDTVVDLIPITLGATEPAQEDIHVTLVANGVLIDDYNTANGTTYEEAPAALFAVQNAGGVVVIPKGGYTGFLQIKFKPSDFLGVSYAVAYTISSIAESGYTISGNLNNGIVAIGIKNQYDGVYKTSGQFTHPSFGVITWDFSKGITQELVTTSANSVSMYPTNTPAANFGAELDITVNPDNTLTETFNGVVTPTPNDDHYDPATKTFFVSGAYQGSGGARAYKATLTYSGPR